MKLKIKFEYQCELELKESEVENTKTKLKKDDFVLCLTNELNEMFLAEDGRTEAGGITIFEHEVEEWLNQWKYKT